MGEHVLIVRAPVRLSLAGGGTDLEAYYQNHPGMVVSATLDKYVRVVVTPTAGPDIQIASSYARTLYRHRAGQPPRWDGDTVLPRAVLEQFGVNRGYHLFLTSEVPPGTGLGSSSAMAVALITALATLTDRSLGRAALAELACQIEIDQLGAPIGKQDQYAAAFGGLNVFTFTPDGVRVEPLAIAADTRRGLEHNVLLFFTGASRQASAILGEQRRRTERDPATLRSLHVIRTHASEMRAALECGDLDRAGDLLHHSWMEKRQLAPGITTDRIDRWYALARDRGARGGKITGAGGGGFLMLYCEDTARDAVIETMEDEGLYRMEFRFEECGARTIVNDLTASGGACRPATVPEPHARDEQSASACITKANSA